MSEVYVYIYDLSKGLASQLSIPILGKHVSGIWHTGIVVFGKEIYFGSNGIESCSPAGTILGQPNEKVKFGNTLKTEEEIDIHLEKLSLNIFHGTKYDLLNHNCNTFSNEFNIWLTGKSIPSYITNLPHEFMQTPFGQMMRPYIEQFSSIRHATNIGYAAYLNQKIDHSTNFCSIYYKENLTYNTDSFLHEEINTSQSRYKDVIKVLILSIKNSFSSSFIPDEIIDLLQSMDAEDYMDIDEKIILFDVLRLLILRDLEYVVVLFVEPVFWMRRVLQKSNHDKVNNQKCKFFCNLIGKHFETIGTNTEVLKLIINFGLIYLNIQATLKTASSLIRNIVINMSTLDDELKLEISSCLMHILTENEMIEDDFTRENIVGSIYYLVKYSEIVKDLAKAQDINKRIRRETPYCQLLHKELQ